jgi:hypothetical protein
MIRDTSLANRRAEALVDLLDIPDSYYQLAADRYRSLGEWLHRPESSVRAFSPAVYPQGSFRYGTVIRPFSKGDEYDLDLVAELQLLSKVYKSQRDLKHLIGDEVKAYAVAKNFNDPAEEKNRCWRLEYADAVNFHMDILPSVPEDESFKKLLEQMNVAPDLASMAIAITDIRHPKYATVDRDWPQSNPRGFGKWFERRMRQRAETRLKSLVANRVYATIDDVPTWEWKTPLQRSIQILKRHRDVLFKDNCNLAPISMIITTLAAQSYEGETTIYDTLVSVLDRMPNHVRPVGKRVPNPVNPGEDFADRWNSEARLEQSFWTWHMQAKADIAMLANQLTKRKLEEHVENKLKLSLADADAERLADDTDIKTPRYASAASSVVIASAPKPWGRP